MKVGLAYPRLPWRWLVGWLGGVYALSQRFEHNNLTQPRHINGVWHVFIV